VQQQDILVVLADERVKRRKGRNNQPEVAVMQPQEVAVMLHNGLKEEGKKKNLTNNQRWQWW